jgi:nickel-dependent lactate racemase
MTVSTTEISLPYGNTETTFSMPQRNLLGVFSPNESTPVADPAAEIRRALREPLGGLPLAEDARGAKRVVIAADDLTRQTPNALILPIVLDELNRAGVADARVTVLIALGTHRPMTPVEIERHFGPQVVGRVAVLNNPWQDPDQLADLGSTPNGTPIQISRMALEADYLIGLGGIVPHHIPGYSAGAKIIQPGISGPETTGATHFLSTRTRRSYLGLVENPVRAEMEAVAARAGLRFILNVVQDARSRLVGAFAGNFIQAHRAGAALAEQVYGVALPGQAEIVLAGSHPCDIEFWQAHKSLYPADIAVKEGGTIIVVTPCPEGVSVMHPEVLEYAGLPAAEIEARILNGAIPDVVAGALALAWARMRQRAHIFMVSSGIAPHAARALGFTPFATIDAALETALVDHGPAAQIAVLTHAPDMLPILGQSKGNV